MADEVKELRIAALLEKGSTWVDIIEQEHCSNSTISKIAKKYNIVKSKKTPSSSENIATIHATTATTNYVPEIKFETIFEKQFSSDELEYLRVAILSHISAYKRQSKSGISALNIKKFEELLEKVQKLIL